MTAQIAQTARTAGALVNGPVLLRSTYGTWQVWDTLLQGKRVFESCSKREATAALVDALRDENNHYRDLLREAGVKDLEKANEIRRLRAALAKAGAL